MLAVKSDSESLTTGLGGYVSNDEMTVFCKGDSIISFAARDGGAFASLQPASNNMSRNAAALSILGPSRRPDSRRNKYGSELEMGV